MTRARSLASRFPSRIHPSVDRSAYDATIKSNCPSINRSAPSSVAQHHHQLQALCPREREREECTSLGVGCARNQVFLASSIVSLSLLLIIALYGVAGMRLASGAAWSLGTHRRRRRRRRSCGSWVPMPNRKANLRVRATDRWSVRLSVRASTRLGSDNHSTTSGGPNAI